MLKKLYTPLVFAMLCFDINKKAGKNRQGQNVMKYSDIKKLYKTIKSNDSINPRDFDIVDLLSLINKISDRLQGEDKLYDLCVECGFIEIAEEGFYVEEGDFICQDCDSNIFWCEDCQEYHRESTHTSITVNTGRRNTITICEMAANSSCDYFRCSDCGEWFDGNNYYYSEVNYEIVCQECLENYIYCEECEEYTVDGCDCSKRSCKIKPYSTDAAKLFGFAPVIKTKAFEIPFVGIELEVESSGDADLDDVVESLHDGFEVVCCEDGSLNDGFEIKTKPENRETIKPLLASIADKLHGQSMQSHNSGRCGLHVNLSRDGMTSLQEAKIYSFFNNLENRKFLYSICRRFSEQTSDNGKTNYCRVNEFSRYSDVKKGWVMDGKKVIRKNGAFTGKYSAVNFKENVLEIRLPRGTIKKSTLLANIDLCMAIVDWTRTGNNEIKLMEKPRSNDFVMWLSKRENQKQYADLWGYCVAKGLNNIDLLQVAL